MMELKIYIYKRLIELGVNIDIEQSDYIDDIGTSTLDCLEIIFNEIIDNTKQ